MNVMSWGTREEAEKDERITRPRLVDHARKPHRQTLESRWLRTHAHMLFDPGSVPLLRDVAAGVGTGGGAAAEHGDNDEDGDGSGSGPAAPKGQAEVSKTLLASRLASTRDSIASCMIMGNLMWVIVVSMVNSGYHDDLDISLGVKGEGDKTDKNNSFSLVFLIFFVMVMAVQLCCMVWHWWISVVEELAHPHVAKQSRAPRTHAARSWQHQHHAQRTARDTRSGKTSQPAIQ